MGFNEIPANSIAFLIYLSQCIGGIGMSAASSTFKPIDSQLIILSRSLSFQIKTAEIELCIHMALLSGGFGPS